MLSFGGNLVGFNLMNYIARNIDNLLIGRFYGPVALGLYTRAYSLLLMPISQINNPIGAVSVPMLSRLNDTPERYLRAYQRVGTTICLLTMPLVAVMIGAADWIVELTLGPEWSEAALIFALLGLSGLVEPIANTVQWLFVTQGRAKDQFRWGLISAALSVTAILAGLPWGAVGVAAAYGVMGLCVRVPLLFWFVGRAGPVNAAMLFQTAQPFLLVAGLILGSIYALRRLVEVPHPLVGAASAVLIAGVITLIFLMATSKGRALLQDIRETVALVARRKQPQP